MTSETPRLTPAPKDVIEALGIAMNQEGTFAIDLERHENGEISVIRNEETFYTSKTVEGGEADVA